MTCIGNYVAFLIFKGDLPIVTIYPNADRRQPLIAENVELIIVERAVGLYKLENGTRIHFSGFTVSGAQCGIFFS